MYSPIVEDFDLEDSKLQITQEDIMNFCRSHGYFCIKISNLADWQKLEQFVTSEIYPLLSDQESFLYANPF